MGDNERIKNIEELNAEFPDMIYEQYPYMLALLLDHDVVFMNTHWNEKDWPEAARQTVMLAVNCNDFFAPASDAERLPYDEIGNLYALWRDDRKMGQLKWVANQRGIECKSWRTV